MKIGLFIPCYIDQFYPKVGIATLELLEKLSCDVTYPSGQTCCGQPMANSGCEQDSVTAYQNFVQNFKDVDYIVTPSGSCAYHVRKHYDIIEQTDAVRHIREHTLDLGEFLINVLKVEKLDSHFPHKVGLHQSCHGLRGLKLGTSSELVLPHISIYERLLSMVSGVELVELSRTDECCGFGGTFATSEAAVSVKMGKDRITDHQSHGAQVITAGDMSCLMHLDGLIQRKKLNVRVKHIAEILNGVEL